MFDFLSKSVEEFMRGFADQASTVMHVMIKTNVDYVTSSIKASIHEGIQEGFEAIRKHIFYLFVAMGATMVGLVFIIWGLAEAFQDYFKTLGPNGTGFMVFGSALLIVGLVCFSMSKTR
jgi:hypothetical protein